MGCYVPFLSKLRNQGLDSMGARRLGRKTEGQPRPWCAVSAKSCSVGQDESLSLVSDTGEGQRGGRWWPRAEPMTEQGN